MIQTLLPLSPAGEICDVDGNCVDAAEDEIFKLTTVGGKLVVESEKVGVPLSLVGCDRWCEERLSHNFV